jgi:hypothetical protein
MSVGNVVALIMQGTNVIATLAPIAFETVQALQTVFAASGEPYSVEIQVLQGRAVLAADTALDEIAAWKKANGFV